MNANTNLIEQRCTEIVFCRPRAGVSPERVLGLATTMQAWVKTQPGFLGRRMFRAEEDGSYVDIVEWASLEDAHAAMAAFESQACAAEMPAVLELETMRMLHAREVPLGS